MQEAVELDRLQHAQLSSATTARVLATSRLTALLSASAVVLPMVAATLAASPATLPYVFHQQVHLSILGD